MAKKPTVLSFSRFLIINNLYIFNRDAEFKFTPRNQPFVSIKSITLNHRRQFFFVDGRGDGLVHLCFRASRLDQGRFDVPEKIGTRGCRIQTHWDPLFRIPKIRIRCGSPRACHDTHETVFAFHRRFETMTSKNQDVCIA